MSGPATVDPFLAELIQDQVAAQRASQAPVMPARTEAELSQAYAQAGYGPSQHQAHHPALLQEQSNHQMDHNGHPSYLDHPEVPDLAAVFAGVAPPWMQPQHQQHHQPEQGMNGFAQPASYPHQGQPTNGTHDNAYASSSHPPQTADSYSYPPEPVSQPKASTSRRARRDSSFHSSDAGPSRSSKRRRSDVSSSPVFEQAKPKKKDNRGRPSAATIAERYQQEEVRLQAALEELKAVVPALKTFYQLDPDAPALPSPPPGADQILIDGVPLPKTDAGALTVVTASAAYVDVLQRERASGKRMVAGLEAVLKATGGEEMLDAWRAHLIVAEEERLALLPPSAPAPSSLLPTSTTHTGPTPSSLDPLNPNYYDPTSYTSSSILDFFTPAPLTAATLPPGTTGKNLTAKEKQELAREKNREKQRRFRERQKVRLAELEEQLVRLREEEEGEGGEEEGGEGEEEGGPVETKPVLEEVVEPAVGAGTGAETEGQEQQ